MSGKKTETRLNKKGVDRPTTYKKVLSPKVEFFLQLIADGFTQKGAARIAHLPVTNIQKTLRSRNGSARLDELTKIRGNVLAEQRARQAFARVDIIEDELVEMAVHGEGKKPGRLRACSLTLQRHGLIDAPGVRVNAQAGAVATASGTMEEIYKSQWLRDKEAALATKFEQQLSSARQLNQ